METQAAEVKRTTYGRPSADEARRRLLVSQFPKTCNVCRTSVSYLDWLAMPVLGRQVDAFAELEMRNHGCGSTLAAMVQIYDLGME